MTKQTIIESVLMFIDVGSIKYTESVSIVSDGTIQGNIGKFLDLGVQKCITYC